MPASMPPRRPPAGSQPPYAEPANLLRTPARVSPAVPAGPAPRTAAATTFGGERW